MAETTTETEAARPLDADVKRVLVESHREFLRFLERRLGRRDLAEDILQDAFARGLEKLETLRDGEAVVPWFYRTLRNATSTTGAGPSRAIVDSSPSPAGRVPTMVV